MTLFLLWVGAGCAACALFGFWAVKFGARRLWTDGEETPARGQAPDSQPGPTVIVPPAPAPALLERAARPRTPRAKPATARPVPAPTAPRPDADRLALWSRQVKAGERAMTIATDGCRVTWHRTCKHGHPSWLVHLGYLKRHRSPDRHIPR